MRKQWPEHQPSLRQILLEADYQCETLKQLVTTALHKRMTFEAFFFSAGWPKRISRVERFTTSVVHRHSPADQAALLGQLLRELDHILYMALDGDMRMKKNQL